MQDEQQSNQLAQTTMQSPYELESGQSQFAAQDEQGAVVWTASEYILHEKTARWYIILGFVAVTIAAVLFFITRDVTVVALALVGGLVFGFYGSRQPKQIGYEIRDKTLVVNERHHEYREFKAFSVVSEDAFSSIVLWPHKRFAQSTSIYYPPEYEDQIVNAIAAHLPFEDHKPDLIEVLMSRIRF